MNIIYPKLCTLNPIYIAKPNIIVMLNSEGVGEGSKSRIIHRPVSLLLTKEIQVKAQKERKTTYFFMSLVVTDW